MQDAYNSLKYERHYLNIGGSYTTAAYLSLTKQSANRKSSFSLNGNISYYRNPGMSNNIKNVSNQWTFREKLGMKINPTEKFEINPSFSYAYSRSDNTLPSALNSKVNIFSSGVDGSVYFMKSLFLGYDLSKNFVKGINSNLTNNPFIINMYLEKRFLKIRGASVRLQAFDIFNQNKFLNRNITETGITDTRTNSLSRYFTINLSVSLQKWKGTPTRNDKTLERRGDGSFIY